MPQTGIVHLNYPYLSSPQPRAFAHRGWHIDDLDGLENALPAFRRATHEGYVYLETDVQVTADGTVVVHHDPTLDRTTDRTGSVELLRWSEVRRARIAGKEPISRLEDLLEELPEAHFNIDVKSDAAVAPFVRALERTGSIDRVAAASFSARRLGRIRKLAGPKLTMAMGPISAGAILAGSRTPLLPLRWLARGSMAQVPMRRGRISIVSKTFIDAVHRVGAEVHVWTIDDREQMIELLDLGVDGIVTDRPDILRDVLVERGVWVS